MGGIVQLSHRRLTCPAWLRPRPWSGIHPRQTWSDHDPACQPPQRDRHVQHDRPGGASLESFAAAGSCTLTRELTEGPYYCDVDSIRSDIREDRPGTTLRLGILVQDSETCAPIPDAVLDVWHCDAEGSYSRVRVGVPSVRRGRGRRSRRKLGSDRRRDLPARRAGHQRRGHRGVRDDLPRLRTVHIHCKVHLDKTTLLTTQLFFDDALTAEVYAAQPCSTSLAATSTTATTPSSRTAWS